MIRIGEVPVSDANVVRSIARTVFDNMPPHKPDAEDYAWLLPDGKRIVIGAYEDTSLVGFCTVDNLEQFLDLTHVPDSPPNTCYVSALALEPEMRDRHIGTRMLKSAVLEAKKAQWNYISGHFRENASTKAAVTCFRATAGGIIKSERVRDHLGSSEIYHYMLARIR
jgi:ribosomal protein S18 acetylase RimI-like enzyme